MSVKRIDIILIFLLVLGIAGTAVSDELSLSASLDKTAIGFEEKVTLVLEIRWTGTIADYRFGMLPIPETERLAVQGSSSAISSDEREGQDITTRTFRYEFKPTKGGTGRIYPITLEYITMPDSVPGQLMTQELTVLIAPPMKKVEETGLAWYYYVIIAVIVIGVVIAVIVFVIKRGASVEPEVKPEQAVLVKLAGIREDGQADRKAFYTRLYRLLLDYITQKYGVAVSGMMPQDVMAALDEKEMPPGEKDKLSGWLTLADREKFAPGGGEPGDTIRLITEIENHMQTLDRRG